MTHGMTSLRRPDACWAWHLALVFLMAVVVCSVAGCGEQDADHGADDEQGHGQNASTPSGVTGDANIAGGADSGRDANFPQQRGRTVADTSARYVEGREVAGARRVFIAADHPAPRPDGPLPYEAACITPECHASFLTRKHPHGPVGSEDCHVCHASDVDGHVYPLKREGNDLCLYCHNASARHTYMHAAVESPGCIVCHDPHASETNYLLKAESVQAMCLACHEMPGGLYMHGPAEAGECTACHLPHGADNARLLRGSDGPEHCLLCHEGIGQQMAEAQHKHQPASDDCLTCHQAHVADERPLLRTAIASGCATCHEPIAQIVQAAPVGHTAVTEGLACANCHDPHAADFDTLLRDRTDQLCYTCHDRPVTTVDGRQVRDIRTAIIGRSNLHGPVAAGQCAGCHEVHGSSHSTLLIQPYPQTFYADFDVDNYALCFGCHDAQLVMAETTTALTGFRDGDRNLHFLHVHRDERGRTCRTCHEVHASDLPNHMANSVPFEATTWQLPINFEKAPDGGSCAPGCHEAVQYTRHNGSADSVGGAGMQGGVP